VTLAVGRKVQQLLERAGATVIMLRSSEAPIDLAPRVVNAERADADVLVSIHANALPDGMNPFVNNGTSVYYFQPRSLELARALDRALVRQFGFRDLGIGRLGAGSSHVDARRPVRGPVHDAARPGSRAGERRRAVALRARDRRGNRSVLARSGGEVNGE
jgi:hypothetical protein